MIKIQKDFVSTKERLNLKIRLKPFWVRFFFGE